MQGIKIKGLKLVGHIIRKKGERIPEKFLMGSFITKDHWENQEQDGSTSS